MKPNLYKLDEILKLDAIEIRSQKWKIAKLWMAQWCLITSEMSRNGWKRKTIRMGGITFTLKIFLEFQFSQSKRMKRSKAKATKISLDSSSIVSSSFGLIQQVHRIGATAATPIRFNKLFTIFRFSSYSLLQMELLSNEI